MRTYLGWKEKNKTRGRRDTFSTGSWHELVLMVPNEPVLELHEFHLAFRQLEPVLKNSFSLGRKPTDANIIYSSKRKPYFLLVISELYRKPETVSEFVSVKYNG
jgi:hypothetical protein